MMGQDILSWIDLIWLPLALLVVHRTQRWWVLSTLVSCMLMMRMQVELIEGTGFAKGFLGLLESSAQSRGLAVYTVFYTIYLLLAYYSPNTKGSVFMAASISIFFMAFFSSSFIMLL